jgi:REP element-mobilizing transposase RayT
MARQLRILIPNGVYHATSHAVEDQSIVEDDRDRRKWTESLDRVATAREWQVLAWVLMDNHFHLYLKTPHGDLDAGMHDLNSGYASAFNRRHDRRGPLFISRYWATLVEGEAYDLEMSRYVHLNPVRAGIVSRPEDYPWGSLKLYYDSRGAPAWLDWRTVLRNFGSSLAVARTRYREFLARGIRERVRSPLKRATAAGTVLGSKDFVERLKVLVGPDLPERGVPAAGSLRFRATPEAVKEAVALEFGIERVDLAVQRRGNIPRLVSMYLMRRWTDLRLSDIGRVCGEVSVQAVSACCRRLEERLARDATLRRKVTACEVRLEGFVRP